ncbi:MAG: phosphoribosylanthranilate isomerase [Lachnospiraceae bacterium]|nr:phosphoribosylanthranilate isomerase [Lachnospiraceae bacterium]
MTKIKLCGLRRECDIEYANELLPEYIGFVFAKKSKRYVSYEEAKQLKAMLDKRIMAVGVFVNEDIERITRLVQEGVIDIVQLHGREDEAYICRLRETVDCPIIQAFRIKDSQDIEVVRASGADYVLLDSGGGSGECFDWSLIEGLDRPYFLAGGLTFENVQEAIRRLQPFAVDVSSALETDGYKDKTKMEQFVDVVRR